MLDVVIIGAGPIGLAAGIESKKHNLSHLILEKGCLVNSLYNYPKNMVFFSTSERLEIGEVPFISHGVKPTRSEALEYYRRVKESWQLNINTYENVLSITGADGKFQIQTSKTNYTCKKVIIATGFYDFPNYLNIPGEDLPKVKHYYDEPHPYANQKIVVIGGGNSAVDVALETFRRGAEVTMVLNKSNLEKNVKYWVLPDIENRIKEGSIKAFWKSQVLSISENTVTINSPEGEIAIDNDFVMAMTGYHPDFTFLEKCGIKSSESEDKKPDYNEKTFETNVPGIYLTGVVCGGMKTQEWFIENSRYHAANAVAHLSKSL